MKRFIRKRDTAPIGDRRKSDKPPRQYNPRPPQLRKKEPVKYMRELQLILPTSQHDIRRNDWNNVHEAR